MLDADRVFSYVVEEAGMGSVLGNEHGLCLSCMEQSLRHLFAWRSLETNMAD